MSEHAHPVGYKSYFKTWFWLLVLTLLALGLGYAPLGAGFKAFLLVTVTLAKIVLIATIFMHLQYEKLNLVMLTFAPLILAIILFAFTFPETQGSATHVLMVR